MKSLLAVSYLTGAALVSGCAFHERSVALDSVGPSTLQPASAGPKGALVVYSAFDPNAEFNDIPYLRQYTDYKILSEEGRLVQIVHNNSGSVAEGPETVELPVGAYRVIARANAYKTVTVPVAILADRLTTVHLDGSASWPNNAALLQSNPVRLPDGEIAGWRANAETLSKP